ncbi:MAG: hypothetical protein ACREGH_02700, partial [Minisyncoccia bacterium]
MVFCNPENSEETTVSNVVSLEEHKKAIASKKRRAALTGCKAWFSRQLNNELMRVGGLLIIFGMGFNLFA